MDMVGLLHNLLDERPLHLLGAIELFFLELMHNLFFLFQALGGQVSDFDLHLVLEFLGHEDKLLAGSAPGRLAAHYKLTECDNPNNITEQQCYLKAALPK